MPASLAFIGGGKMAEALIKGTLSAGILRPDQIFAADKSPERLAHLSHEYAVRTTEDNIEAAGSARFIVIALKPQDIPAALALIGPRLSGQLVISIAAGMSTGRLRGILGADVPIVRVMPNTPALVGEGMSALCFSGDVGGEQRDFVFSVFRALGDAVEVDESLMNQVTAVSGSGPAYFFLFTALLARAGAKTGLPDDLAYRLAVQTALGASRMLAETGIPASELIKMVASPGGTTVAALDVFDQLSIDDIMERAVEAAWRRAEELDAGS